ncbi:MAG: GspH/FimT family protein [Pseudomonadota bacterium]
MRFTRPNQSAAEGFSLIELLAVLAIVAVVAALGAPPLGDWLAEQRMRADLAALARDFHFARHEAAKRNVTVSLCASNDAVSCSGSRTWSAGWIVFANLDGDRPASRDQGEPLLVVRQQTARNRIVSNRADFQLRGDLRRATNGTVLACHTKRRIAPRALVISYTGRPRSVRGNPSRSLACD